MIAHASTAARDAEQEDMHWHAVDIFQFSYVYCYFVYLTKEVDVIHIDVEGGVHLELQLPLPGRVDPRLPYLGSRHSSHAAHSQSYDRTPAAGLHQRGPVRATTSGAKKKDLWNSLSRAELELSQRSVAQGVSPHYPPA